MGEDKDIQEDEDFDWDAEQIRFQERNENLDRTIQAALARMKLPEQGSVSLDQKTLRITSEPGTNLKEYLDRKPEELEKARFVIRNLPEDGLQPYEVWQVPEIEHGDYVLLVGTYDGLIKLWMDLEGKKEPQ